MLRWPFLAAGAAALATLAAGAAAWRWWTAPPSSPLAPLAAAARWAPGEAQGVVVVAQPRRLVRWLRQQPVYPAFVATAALPVPEKTGTLAPLAMSLVRTARGPVVVWWGSGGTGLAAQVKRTHVAGLRQVAALRSLGWREEVGEGDLVRVAAFMGSWAAAEAPPAPPPPADEQGCALVKVQGQWWRLRVSRAALHATTDTPPPLPQCSGASSLASWDLAPLLGRPAAAGLPRALLLTSDGEWALRFSDAAPFPRLERFPQGGEASPPSTLAPPTRQLHLPSGTLFIAQDREWSLATRADLLAQLPQVTPGAHWGCLRGEQVAKAFARAAQLWQTLPGMPSPAKLTQLASAFEPVQECAWRVDTNGGQLEVRW